MPIIKSAKKRVKTAKKATARNAKTKKSLRGAIKAFHGKITGTNQSKAQSALDKAVKKGVISKNKAARKKSQLAKKAKASGLKTTASTTKKVVTKTVAKKKPAAKKAPVVKKKPATKKK